MPKSTSSEMKIACALALIVSMVVFQTVPAAGRKDGRTFDGPRIAWDTSSESKIAPRGGYSRVRRLPDGSYVAAFEDRRGNVNFSRSADMVTWSKGITVIPAFVVRSADRDVRVNVANAEIFPLADGTLLCGGNYRPSAEDVYPYSIVVARSEDGGVTWSEPTVLYEAGPRFGDGCWEPSFLQLPDGRVQVYFANENPYRQSDEQEISMLESRDGGRTWSREAVTVSFRKGHRDGMPVAECFGDEVVVVMAPPWRSQETHGWTMPCSGRSAGWPAWSLTALWTFLPEERSAGQSATGFLFRNLPPQPPDTACKGRRTGRSY